MSKSIIHTHLAPQAIGTYSQAVKVGGTVYKRLQIIPCLSDTVCALFRRILGYVKGCENLSCRTW